MEHEPSEHPQPDALFQKPAGILLLALILLLAGIASALTAMRFAVRGREVEVPDLIGKTQEEAQRILEAQRLVLRAAMGKRFNETIPEGRILDQNPKPGSRLKTNRSVRILLSLGPRRFPVPNLVGTSLRAAQLTLGQRGFAIGRTLYAHTGDGEPSTVVYQYPPPGSQEGSDPSVNVLISLGLLEQYYIMPDLLGQSADLVESKIQAEGFRLDKVTMRRYPGAPGGVVIQQKPQAGYRVSKSDTILLEVSQ